MKIRLSPQLAYLIGAWKHRRTKEGIGVLGSEGLCAAFASGLIACGIAAPEEIRAEGDKVFTYHSAYRAFFDDVLAREQDVFKYRNAYSMAFFAGMYDACGGERRGKAYLAKADGADEFALLRLNWKVARTGATLWVGPADEFMEWIKHFRKVEMPVAPPEPEAARVKKKVERRPRRVYPTPPA